MKSYLKGTIRSLLKISARPDPSRSSYNIPLLNLKVNSKVADIYIIMMITLVNAHSLHVHQHIAEVQYEQQY